MHRSRRPGLPLLLLGAQLWQVGFDRIPPATLGLIAANVVVFLRLVRLPWDASAACVGAIHVWHWGQYRRLALAPFFHGNDWHLYYNMASFLWKGLSLERSMGTLKFFLLNMFLAVTCSGVLVALAELWARIQNDPSVLATCAVGYSGVIFALKVITTHNLPPGSMTSLMGIIAVPTRLAVWAELLLISLLVPNASFLGHLAGILVGLLYVKGPLRYLLDQIHACLSGRPTTSSWSSQPFRSVGRSGRSGEVRHTDRPVQSRDGIYGDESDDEQLRAAIAASLSDADRDAQRRARLAAQSRHEAAAGRDVRSRSRGFAERPPPTWGTGSSGSTLGGAVQQGQTAEDDDADLQEAIRRSLGLSSDNLYPVLDNGNHHRAEPSAPPLEEDDYSANREHTAVLPPPPAHHSNDIHSARLRRFGTEH